MSKSTSVYHITTIIFINFLQFMPKHIMYIFNKIIFSMNSLIVYLKEAQKRNFTSCYEEVLLPATDKRTATLHLFRVGAIHKPGGTYITVLRSAKEKFCSDVQSRSVASSSNAKMLSTVQLSAVAPTLRKRRENMASPKSILDGKNSSYTSTKITDYFHKVNYLQYTRTVRAVVEQVQVVPIDAKVGIPLTCQPMDSLHKKVPGLLLELLYHHTLYVSV